MSIFCDGDTKVVIQGITGRDGSFHSRSMIDYGTNVVAGVTPGRGGQTFNGTIPIFNTVADAVRETGADASVVFVPPFAASGAVFEAADAGCRLVVCITEGVPTLDMIRIIPFLRDKGVTLVGPNCPGFINPGQAKLGIMPGDIVTEGPVGLISRSGTLTYEVVYALTKAGLGQTTCLGIGGDPVIGTSFMDALRAFDADPETKALVMIGEIGGDAEERAAEYIQQNMDIPVVSFIAGRTAPPGKRMGHAGAIVSGGSGTAAEKKKILESAGIPVADRPVDVVPLLRDLWKEAP